MRIRADRCGGKAGVHLALAFFRVREAPAIGAGPVAVAAVITVGFAQVEFTDAADAIAGVAKALVVGGRVLRQGAGVAETAEAARLHAGGQADARGGADRGVGSALREAHAARGEAVEVGGLQKVSAG